MGIRQHFNFGRMLKAKYPNLFSDQFDYKNMSVYSSALKRTISSAMSQISGIYYKTQGVQLNTPGNSEYYLPPWSDPSEIPKMEGIDALPNGMNLHEISASEKGVNFMFRADQDCQEIQKASVKSVDALDKSVFNVVKDSYDLFSQHGFSIEKMYKNKVPETFCNFAEICDALTGLLYRDPSNRINDLPYSLQAHMIFINSLYNYIPYSENKKRQYYVTKLFQEWRDILVNIQNANEGKPSTDPRQIYLFNGHGENLAAVLLELHDGEILDKILAVYRELKGDATNVNSQEELDAFSKNVNAKLAVLDISFTSSLVFEVFSEEDEDDIKGRTCYVIIYRR
jgi:hypothetical protein